MVLAPSLTLPSISDFSFCHASTSLPSVTAMSAYISAFPSSKTAFGVVHEPFLQTEYCNTVRFNSLRSLSYPWKIITFVPLISLIIGSELVRIPLCKVDSVMLSVWPFCFNFAIGWLAALWFHADVFSANESSIKEHVQPSLFWLNLLGFPQNLKVVLFKSCCQSTRNAQYKWIYAEAVAEQDDFGRNCTSTCNFPPTPAVIILLIP